MNNFEEIAKEAASSRKKLILLIPDNIKVDPKHLGKLTNEQFISAFRDLQKFIIKLYGEIEKCPFDWGYPDFETTDGYYNRLTDFLFSFVFCGAYNEGTLNVDMKKFAKFSVIKRHKKADSMIKCFNKNGLIIDGYDRKSLSFTVTYPKNPDVIVVLNTYVYALGKNALHWSAREMCMWNFSYRFIEDSSMQKYETVFHTKMDLSSEKIKKIQYWLHEEAEEYGYKINVSHPYEKNCIQYQKGVKSFLLAGEKEIKGVPVIFSKVIFRNVFENNKETILKLNAKFPEVFKSNCTMCNGSKTKDSKCSMRICYDIEGKQQKNCAYRSFIFYNPKLEDIKIILDLFLLENNIKKPS